jgi:nuclear protein localization family protein 4
MCIYQVGWLFTDLEPEANGKVSYKRNINTHLLSAEECIMAAHFQNEHPNICSQASLGYFGSKFVTVCISGNESNQVDTTGYQVSNQCVALVKDDCLVPTIDAPELGYIRESTNEQYVPDVFYKAKDEYGIEVTKLARPLPLDYVIVELTTTTPLRPKPTLPGGRGDPFPIENRELMGESQTFEAFVKYIDQQKGSNFLCIVSDFHFLFFLYTTNVVSLQPHMPELCQAIQRQDKEGVNRWREGEWWQMVEQLIIASSMPSPDIMKAGGLEFPPPVSSNDMWRCQYCTLDNPPMVNNCNVCGLPRN